jgi:hypothetical protein
MANATPRDARAGFDIFRSAGGQITLEELTNRLVQAGYGPVAKRTFDHYHSLVDAGYNRYVAINRFDVARASVPYENASAIGRYDYYEVDLGVNVIFAKGSRLLEASGRANETGEVGAMLRFFDAEVVEGLKKLKPQPGNMVTIRFLEAGRTIGGRVIDADLRSDPATVEIEYSRLLSIAEIGIGDRLPVREIQFVLRGPEDSIQTLDVVNRRLYHFFELIEGVRSLVNEAGSRQEDPVYAEPPVLRSLSVASAAQLLLEVADRLGDLLPFALIAAVLKIAGAVPAKRKEWYEGTGQKHRNRLSVIETELKQLELDARREEAALRTEMITRMRSIFPQTTLSDEEMAKLISEYVVPPLRALGEIGIANLLANDEPADDEE